MPSDTGETMKSPATGGSVFATPTSPAPGGRRQDESVYRFRTRIRYCDLLFGRMGWLRQDRGLCPFACST